MEQTAEKELFSLFMQETLKTLQEKLLGAPTRDEKLFYRTLFDLKLQLSQEKRIGKVLL